MASNERPAIDNNEVNGTGVGPWKDLKPIVPDAMGACRFPPNFHGSSTNVSLWSSHAPPRRNEPFNRSFQLTREPRTDRKTYCPPGPGGCVFST